MSSNAGLCIGVPLSSVWLLDRKGKQQPGTDDRRFLGDSGARYDPPESPGSSEIRRLGRGRLVGGMALCHALSVRFEGLAGPAGGNFRPFPFAPSRLIGYNGRMKCRAAANTAVYQQSGQQVGSRQAKRRREDCPYGSNTCDRRLRFGKDGVYL